MGRFDYLKNYTGTQKNMRKHAVRINPKKSKNNLCLVCTSHPCQCHTQQQIKDRNLVQRQGGSWSSGSKKEKKKTTPKIPRSDYIRRLKKKDPTISKSDLKKALRAAGYSTGWL